jgi:uncharacterized protein
MDVSTLEGFLTAIVIGPRAVHPPEWLPWVWDMQEGQAEAKFENREQADRIVSLVVRHYNTVVHTFLDDPASFKPVFTLRNQWGAAEWCEGFILGFQFSDEAWSLLAVGEPTWFTPFLRLGTDDGIHMTKKLGDAERWMNEIDIIAREDSRLLERQACQTAWRSRAARISPGRAERCCAGSSRRAKGRPQRSVSLWQWKEVQEVLRSG